MTSEYRLGSQTAWAESKLYTFQLCALVSPSVKIILLQTYVYIMRLKELILAKPKLAKH